MVNLIVAPLQKIEQILVLAEHPISFYFSRCRSVNFDKVLFVAPYKTDIPVLRFVHINRDRFGDLNKFHLILTDRINFDVRGIKELRFQQFRINPINSLITFYIFDFQEPLPFLQFIVNFNVLIRLWNKLISRCNNM